MRIHVGVISFAIKITLTFNNSQKIAWGLLLEIPLFSWYSVTPKCSKHLGVNLLASEFGPHSSENQWRNYRVASLQNAMDL